MKLRIINIALIFSSIAVFFPAHGSESEGSLGDHVGNSAPDVTLVTCEDGLHVVKNLGSLQTWVVKDQEIFANEVEESMEALTLDWVYDGFSPEGEAFQLRVGSHYGSPEGFPASYRRGEQVFLTRCIRQGVPG